MPYVLPIFMLLLMTFSAGALARKVWGYLVHYGKAWAVLGSIAAFATSFVALGLVIGILFSAVFGR